jgi:hypothetical protein
MELDGDPKAAGTTDGAAWRRVTHPTDAHPTDAEPHRARSSILVPMAPLEDETPPAGRKPPAGRMSSIGSLMARSTRRLSKSTSLDSSVMDLVRSGGELHGVDVTAVIELLQSALQPERDVPATAHGGAENLLRKVVRSKHSHLYARSKHSHFYVCSKHLHLYVCSKFSRLYARSKHSKFRTRISV